eukprot:scaffold116774_cov67-Phaeocystis_antarctica.AAC.2
MQQHRHRNQVEVTSATADMHPATLDHDIELGRAVAQAEELLRVCRQVAVSQRGEDSRVSRAVRAGESGPGRRRLIDRPVEVFTALLDERPRLAPSRVQALSAYDPVEGVIGHVAARDLLSKLVRRVPLGLVVERVDRQPPAAELVAAEERESVGRVVCAVGTGREARAHGVDSAGVVDGAVARRVGPLEASEHPAPQLCGLDLRQGAAPRQRVWARQAGRVRGEATECGRQCDEECESHALRRAAHRAKSPDDGDHEDDETSVQDAIDRDRGQQPLEEHAVADLVRIHLAQRGEDEAHVEEHPAQDEDGPLGRWRIDLLVRGAVDRVQKPRQGALQLGADVVVVQPLQQPHAPAHKDSQRRNLVDGDESQAVNERLQDEAAEGEGHAQGGGQEVGDVDEVLPSYGAGGAFHGAQREV